MMNLTKLTLLTVGLAFSLSANAVGGKSDGQLVSDCKASVKAQYQSVDRIKLSNISSRRGIFKAKMKVTADGKRSRVLCVIEEDQAIALSCDSGTKCPSSTIASN